MIFECYHCLLRKCITFANQSALVLIHSRINFIISKRALTIEFLFEISNPTQRISIKFNTSSFLLSYIDKMIGIEAKDNWNERNFCKLLTSTLFHFSRFIINCCIQITKFVQTLMIFTRKTYLEYPLFSCEVTMLQ